MLLVRKQKFQDIEEDLSFHLSDAVKEECGLGKNFYDYIHSSASV